LGNGEIIRRNGRPDFDVPAALHIRRIARQLDEARPSVARSLTNGQPGTLADRAHSQAQRRAAVGLKPGGGIVAGFDQPTAERQHRGVAGCGDADGRAPAAADQFRAEGRPCRRLK